MKFSSTSGKYIWSLLLTAFLVMGNAVVPAHAVTAGAACTKKGAKVKIGKENFVCSQNPARKSKKLVWVWADCLVADDSYKAGVASQRQLEETASKTITMLNVDIENIKKQIVANEPEAKTWDAKAAEFKAKAAADTKKAEELKAEALKGGITSVDSKFKTNLQVALLDKTLTPAEVTQLATAWGTTADKVPFIIEFISAEDRIRSANSYSIGARNAERKAASLRSTDILELKNRQVRSAETNVSLGKAQLSSLLSTRKSACSPAVWRALR